MGLLEELLYIFYIAPCYISLIYFTMLKIADGWVIKKSYTQNKISYIKVIILCFIPIVNIALAYHSIKWIIKSIIK